MKNYDVIILGGGGGTKLRPVSAMGKTVAVIEKEDLGGTCLNRGCIPSKMLIHVADVADEIREAHRFNLKVDTNIGVDFSGLVKRVTDFVTSESKKIEDFYRQADNVDFYHGEARFVADKVVEVNGEKLTANYIFIATGTRPLVPQIEGLEGTPFMTSREALRNTKQPKSMIVIGGGYIATELGHFYGALGTKVQFLVRSRLLGNEDSEIAAEFTRVFCQKYDVALESGVKKVEYEEGQFKVEVQEKSGSCATFEAESLLLATGVVPNSDNLGLENTAISTNKSGYIEVNDRLETAVKGVFALGDVAGNYLFRHSVNFEGEYLLRTLFKSPSDEPIEYSPMPHAVFSSPQVAGVGKTEDQLKEEGADYFVGVNKYENSAMGDALRSDHGMVKLMFERGTKKLIGAHIIGPEASDMIHMLIAYMNMNATLDDLLRTIYIHPALPENVRNAARKAEAAMQIE